MKRIRWAIAGTALVAAGTVMAAQDHGSQHGAQANTGATALVMTAGEVRKVDLDSGKVTIRHEPITNLGMPAMTMVFIADKNVLKPVKAGDKVLFHAQTANGAMTVTHIQAQK